MTNKRRKSLIITKDSVDIHLATKDSIVTTTAHAVATVFGKRHGNVVRDIDALDCSEEFTQLNFELSKYKDSSGKINKSYNITKDGFVFLAMGFRGNTAAQFKEAYIKAFNDMEAQIYQDHAEQLTALSEVCKEQRGYIERLEVNQRHPDTTDMLPEHLRQIIYGLNTSLQGNINMLLMSISKNTGFSQNVRITNLRAVMENLKLVIRQIDLVIQSDLKREDEMLNNINISSFN